jgi:hypothetical protein
MPQSFRTWSILWLLVLASVAIVVYWPGLNGWYFADDFCYYFESPGSKLLYFFNHKNPGNVIYRPLLSTFIAAVQSIWGMQTGPIHLMNLLCHIVLSWLVAITVVRLGYSRIHGMIGSTFMLLAQINSYAVLGIDTLSQVGGVLFGFLAGWLLFFPGRRADAAVADRPARPAPLHFLLSLLCLAISLGFKETSTSYLGVVAIALLAANIEQSPRQKAFMRTALQLLPFVILIGVYMVVRSQFVTELPKFGEGRYDMKLGMNIPKNIALFLAASSTAHSSVAAYVASYTRDVPMLVAIAIPTLLFVGLLCWGLWLARRDRPVQTFLLLYVIGFFPIVLFNRVSELYIYNSFPFLAALVGIAMGELWRRAAARRSRIALAMALGSLLVIHVASLRSKTGYIDANGERAAELLEELRPIVASAPRNARLYLVNPPNSTVEYSTYRMNDFNVFIAGLEGVASYLGREDLRMELLSQGDSTRNLRASDSTLIVTMRDGRVVPVPERLPQ